MKTLRITTCFLLLATHLAGCKIIQTVPEGGTIVSRTGQHDCAAGTTCEIDVENGSVFSDTFTAVANPGYTFVGWKKAEKYLCGTSTEPCALEGVPAQFTSQDVDLYLEPVFEPVAQQDPSDPDPTDPTPPEEPEPEPVLFDVTVQAQIYGPIADATATLADATSGEVVCSGVTGSLDAAVGAGVVVFPASCFEDIALAVITIENGVEYRIEATNPPDEISQSINSAMHSVLVASRLDERTVHLNALTDAAFQSVSYMIEADYDADEIEDALDGISTRLLKSDLSGDGIVDYEDVPLWNQDLDRDKIVPTEDELLQLSNLYGRRKDGTFAAVAIFADNTPLRNRTTFGGDISLMSTSGSGDDILVLAEADIFNLPVAGTVDITSPESPVVGQTEGFFDLAYFAPSKLHEYENLAFVEGLLSGVRKLVVFDFTTERPSLVNADAYIPSEGGEITSIGFRQGVAYASVKSINPQTTLEEYRLDILALGADGTATLTGSVPLLDQANNILATDALVLVRSDWDTSSPDITDIRIFTVSDDGTNLEEVGIVDTYDYGTQSAMAVSGNLLLFTDHDCCSPSAGRPESLVIYNIANPSQPEFVSATKLQDGARAGFQVVGDRVYTGHDNGIRPIDISDPGNPVVKGNYWVNYVTDFVVKGDLAYVGNRQAEILVLDVSQVSPLEKASAASSYPAQEAVLQSSGDLVYSFKNGFYELLDASDPENLTLLESRNMLAPTGPLARFEDFLYPVSDFTYESLDMSDPYNVASNERDVCADGGFVASAAQLVEGDLLYSMGRSIAAGECGNVTGREIGVRSLSNPAAPELLSSVAVNTFASGGVAKSGDTLFAGQGRRVLVADVSNPSAISLQGELQMEPADNLNRDASDVAVSEGVLLITQNEAGVAYMDLEDVPRNMIDVDSFIQFPEDPDLYARAVRIPLPKPINRLEEDGAIVYMVATDQIYIVDTRGEEGPVFRGTLLTESPIVDIRIADNALLVATWDGILAYRRMDPDKTLKMRYSNLNIE